MSEENAGPMLFGDRIITYPDGSPAYADHFSAGQVVPINIKTAVLQINPPQAPSHSPDKR